MEKIEYRVVQKMYVTFTLNKAQYSATYRKYAGSKDNRYVNNYLWSSVFYYYNKKDLYKVLREHIKKGTHFASSGLMRKGGILAPL